MLTQIFDIIYNVDSQDSFSDNFYLTLGIFGSCCKMCTLLISRENYAILIDTLHEEPFVPVNTDEIKIRTRFDKLAKFAMMVNKEFKTMVLIQFLVSISMFCFDLYLLTQIEVGSKFMEMMLFAMCTLMQILYYCWYGNEIKLKSLEVPNMVIESNWTSLDNDAKKILLMIMKRATKPIEFSSAHLVSMNLETFKTILKTSYSAMSVLQQDKIH
ncbi:odorant receptor 10-like [Colletes latitarsis]|uniref:odorant receptor 10-like n=1 Tax=Colletes latitarsis TaxID=2605962 RepID=UPI0040367393